MPNIIQQNIEIINQKITQAVLASNRKVNDVRLVAVSKRFPVTSIEIAQNAGQSLFGENYIQESKEKFNTITTRPNFHFIGHLQSNKAKTACDIFTMIETVDRYSLAKGLNKHMANKGENLDILIQVNIGKDPNKAGVSEEDAEKLIGDIQKLSSLKICGLMTIPPLTLSAEEARPYFASLRKLSERLAQKGLFANNEKIELSMGMSNDFHIAIEEGATLVRVGTAIFGQRPELKP